MQSLIVKSKRKEYEGIAKNAKLKRVLPTNTFLVFLFVFHSTLCALSLCREEKERLKFFNML